MNDFTLFFTIGWKHIISVDALDHLLFIAALTCLYDLKHWKQLFILVTAFTIGHSITLILSTYDIVRFNVRWVEFLIPLTIVITAVLNFFQAGKTPRHLSGKYLLALLFGLIHGMGFANTIRFMLAQSQDIFLPLLGFNAGIEVSQVLVVILLVSLAYLLIHKAELPRKSWVAALSGLTGSFALYLCLQRWPL